MVMERSTKVGCMLPMAAQAFGDQVLNGFGTMSSPTQRRTYACDLVWPLLSTPRRSVLSEMKVSVSSISIVGCQRSMARKTVAGVTLAADRGLGTSLLSMSSRLVLPHRL